MVKPTYLVERCVEGQRLTYYLSAADAAFWEQHWQQHFTPCTEYSQAQLRRENAEGRLSLGELSVHWRKFCAGVKQVLKKD
jgi:hypothetical protein